MFGRRMRGGLLIGSLAATIMLTGCAASAAPAAEQTSPPPTSAAPTPTATAQEPSPDPLSTVSTIVIRPEAVELRDASGGVVHSLDYLADATEALAVLTTVFGEAPADTDSPGNSHSPPSTVHRWGAFELWEVQYVDNWEGFGAPRTLYWPSYRVMFTGAESHSIALATTEGRQTGDSWTDLIAAPNLQTNPSGCSGPYTDFVEYPVTGADGTEYLYKISVDYRPTGDGQSIASIGAPMFVAEDGCA